jgi:hypothetical protein
MSTKPTSKPQESTSNPHVAAVSASSNRRSNRLINPSSADSHIPIATTQDHLGTSASAPSTSSNRQSNRLSNLGGADSSQSHTAPRQDQTERDVDARPNKRRCREKPHSDAVSSISASSAKSRAVQTLSTTLNVHHSPDETYTKPEVARRRKRFTKKLSKHLMSLKGIKAKDLKTFRAYVHDRLSKFDAHSVSKFFEERGKNVIRGRQHKCDN